MFKTLRKSTSNFSTVHSPKPRLPLILSKLSYKFFDHPVLHAHRTSDKPESSPDPFTTTPPSRPPLVIIIPVYPQSAFLVRFFTSPASTPSPLFSFFSIASTKLDTALFVSLAAGVAAGVTAAGADAAGVARRPPSAQRRTRAMRNGGMRAMRRMGFSMPASASLSSMGPAPAFSSASSKGRRRDSAASRDLPRSSRGLAMGLEDLAAEDSRFLVSAARLTWNVWAAKVEAAAGECVTRMLSKTMP
mmetsp:Transcript_16590/g.42750  ORF Transcript_16590/g.42750 Transcript_16590/m.42750 type:complete len:246 (+) Transcript_16590:214-951(+)